MVLLYVCVCVLCLIALWATYLPNNKTRHLLSCCKLCCNTYSYNTIILIPEKIVEKELWEEFYEPMQGAFRINQNTGKKHQIYKVRCVGEKSAFCIFLGPNFTHPWFIVQKGG